MKKRSTQNANTVPVEKLAVDREVVPEPTLEIIQFRSWVTKKKLVKETEEEYLQR